MVYMDQDALWSYTVTGLKLIAISIIVGIATGAIALTTSLVASPVILFFSAVVQIIVTILLTGYLAQELWGWE